MAKYVYPAIFTKDGELYSVSFPDFENCYTQGDSISDAVDMAEDVLCLTLYNLFVDGKPSPNPSNVKNIKVDSDSFVSLVSCDTKEYERFYDKRTVKKTLTLPAWLNDMSEQAGINFSRVLQKGLKKELKIDR